MNMLIAETSMAWSDAAVMIAAIIGVTIIVWRNS